MISPSIPLLPQRFESNLNREETQKLNWSEKTPCGEYLFLGWGAVAEEQDDFSGVPQ